MTIMKVLAGAMLVLTSASMAGAAAESTQVPFASQAFVACANGGDGELIDLSGTLHIVTHTTEDANGGLHTYFHFQPQGATAVGQVTGDIYRAVGVTQQSMNIHSSGFPVTQTFVNNFRMIGPGPGNNLQFHQTMHVTIDANGTTTVDFDKPSINCN